MQFDYVTVLDPSMQMQCVLENAMDVGYRLATNDLWTASFSLPAGDPKNIYCKAHDFVYIPDGERDLGLYRIIGMPHSDETGRGGIKTYSLEHVMATLLDDILFGYHEIGGTTVTTAAVIKYILAQQGTARWALGECDFNDQFAYKFENTSLLSALLSLGNVMAAEYTWVFDTSVTPWRVSLKRADATAGCGIHYLRNMQGITKTMDASTLVTRLYPLGYGEGVNQLTIKEVNGGLPYIDADTTKTWGVKCAPYADTRIEDAATLLARSRAVLEGLKNPYIAYTAAAIDLSRQTGQSWDRHMPGKLVHAMDGEHGLDFMARIVCIEKSSVRGDPANIVITIANSPRDVADSINTLADRVGIGELYSQGATNVYSQQFADNADATHPAKMRIYVPRGCVRINSMLLSWECEAFRAYETGAEAGGATASTTSGGGVSRTTSEAAGAESLLIPARIVSLEKGTGTPMLEGLAASNTQMNLIQTTNAASGNTGSASNGTTSQPDSVNTVACPSFTSGASSPGTSSTNGGNTGSRSLTTVGSRENTGNNAVTGSHYHYMYHTHTINSHTHTTPNHSHTVASHAHTVGAHQHGMGHTHTMAHTHSLNAHTHNVPAHQHGMTHYHLFSHSHTVPEVTVEIPAHTHSVSVGSHTHSVTLGNHVHAIEYGIYEGTRASAVSLVVDGATVPASELKASEMDIVKYLKKDAEGKITRGTWHEVQIVPDKLTRIVANIFVQTFVQSVGGGDY